MQAVVPRREEDGARQIWTVGDWVLTVDRRPEVSSLWAVLPDPSAQGVGHVAYGCLGGVEAVVHLSHDGAALAYHGDSARLVLLREATDEEVRAEDRRVARDVALHCDAVRAGRPGQADGRSTEP